MQRTSKFKFKLNIKYKNKNKITFVLSSINKKKFKKTLQPTKLITYKAYLRKITYSCSNLNS